MTSFLNDSLKVVGALCFSGICCLFFLERAFRIAKSKTSLRLCCVKAEHSMYSIWFCSATFLAYFESTGFCPFLFKSRTLPKLCLRSDWVPTRMIGTSGEVDWTSGSHLWRTDWSEEWDITLKQSIKTLASLYDRSLRESNSDWK